MSLHTESPRAKARREQALRNILAARRRKILRQRTSSDQAVAARRSSSASASTLRRGRPAPREAGVGDVLEMQESQNGLYVTVPEQPATNDTQEIIIQTLGGGSTGSSSAVVSSVKRNNGSSNSSNNSNNSSNNNGTQAATKPLNSRSGNSAGSITEHRGKKIVAMPASLYNHFRPVESNIPIEDMSQFLYFGQKLRGTGIGKDSAPASPSPKKLLAGLEDMLDDEMNSVDRSSSSGISSSVSGKSTKMRTTSLREHTTRPACPDKVAEARGNSINATNTEKNDGSPSNLSLRIVVTEATTTTMASSSTTTGAPIASTTTVSSTTTLTSSTVASSTSTTTTTTTTTTEETPRSTVAPRNKQQEQQQQQHVTEPQPQSQSQQRQRSALRNSHVAETGGAITSSSSPAASRLSAGATVEQAAAQHSSRANAAAAAAAAAPPQQQQQQQPGFTIRWTDARPASAASKRRRLAAAAAASRRRDKSARNMDEPTAATAVSSTTASTSTSTTTAIPTTTTTAASNDAAVFPVTPKMMIPEVTAPPPTTTTTLTSTSTTEEIETTTEKEIVTTTVDRSSDTSELQNAQRPSSTAKPEPSTTTMTTSAAPSTELVEEEVPTTSASPATTPRPTSASPERSPEVRARNLADKAKDDVLPIMQLYNTSSMFNASELASTTTTTSTSTTSTSTTTTATTTVLPTEVVVEPIPPTATTTTTIVEPVTESSTTTTSSTARTTTTATTSTTTTAAAAAASTTTRPKPERHSTSRHMTSNNIGNRPENRTGSAKPHRREFPGEFNGSGYYPFELNNDNVNGNNNNNNRTFFEPPAFVTVGSREPIVNISEVISRRHDGDALASQETVAVVSYILATLVVFPIAVGVGLILRRLILRNRKVLEESDTSSEISCRKDALNLETGDFKMSIEKTITKLPRIQHLCHEAEKPPPPSSQESRWEFQRDKLRLQTILGEGNFGQVWKAEADDLTGHQGTTRLVAVKTVKEGASDREKEDLVRELEIMQRVGSHPNVVTLLGCCTEQEPHYLILEYVMYGKLLAYLRDHRTRQDFYNFSEDSAALTSRDLTVFGYCVARGMEYLASKKIIHRDLAARNVLVDHNKLCKIADFGMSRFANEDGEVIETRHGRNALPIRWMAPESLIYSLFTTKTDVWSFGILMWEIVTLGSTPYPDMTAREVMRSVQSGYRLERPSHCRSELFRIIARCWHADPDRRPEFQVLRRDLAQLLEDNMNGHYVDLESFASECTD